MASAAKQLVKNLSWSAFAQADDLKKRLWFTLAAIVVFRIGTYVPLPGIDATVMGEIVSHHSGGIVAILDRFSGGALGRMSIFALGIMPYISASIIVQLMTAVSPHLEALKKEGESGRKVINQYTRYGTVLICLLQSYGVAAGLEHMSGPSGGLVYDSGFLFRMASVITLTGGTLFLMWLGEQITSRGIGNGISLLIFSGIVANIPSALAVMYDRGRSGEYDSLFVMVVFAAVAAMILLIVLVERAQRRIPVQYPKRQVKTKMVAAQTAHMPLRINTPGVIPPIFASSILTLPMTVISFSAGQSDGILGTIATYLAPQKPLYLALYVALIVFFAFFYTAIVFNPEETAENLRKNGGFVPGYRPGANTASYFDFVLTRLTVIGAAYLSFVCVLPETMIAKYSLPFALGGTSLLIVVSVCIDTVAQVHSHLLAHQYGDVLKKMGMDAPGAPKKRRR
ncbi:preprotein translocase subunit SecY [Alphaproteobacteria bacterium]|nr:preprotein translocase subunit SecY [Alphaproteobacteria bacterium]